MSPTELERDIGVVEQQEQDLVFASFSPRDALEVGLRLIALASAGGKGIEIDIEVHGHCLFHHAMAGTDRSNTDWIRRKRNTMLLTGGCSLLAFLRLQQEGISITEKYGVSDTEHAPGGGGFPLRLRTREVIGHVIVSGLPHMEDHALVISALSTQITAQMTDRMTVQSVTR